MATKQKEAKDEEEAEIEAVEEQREIESMIGLQED